MLSKENVETYLPQVIAERIGRKRHLKDWAQHHPKSQNNSFFLAKVWYSVRDWTRPLPTQTSSGSKSHVAKCAVAVKYVIFFTMPLAAH